MHGDSVKGASLPTAGVVGREPSAGCGSPAVMTVLAAFNWVVTRMDGLPFRISQGWVPGTGQNGEWRRR